MVFRKQQQIDFFDMSLHFYSIFLFLLKYIKTELLPRIRLHFLWIFEMNTNVFFSCKTTWIYVVLLKKNFSFFHVLHRNSIFMFLLKSITTYFFPFITLHVYLFLEKLYKLCFFPCICFNFCGIETTTNDCFFSRIILQFVFFVFVFCGNL